MLDVQGPHKEEIVNDQKANAKPLQLSGSIHAKNNHESNQLQYQSWLKNTVVP